MASLILFGVSIILILMGLPAHFVILSKLSEAGIEVKYFAHLGDTLRSYSAYARLAKERQWSLWPVRACYAAYVGLLGAVVALVLNPSMLDALFKWTYRSAH